jgi:putative FmdB family regulatory protein
MPLYLYQCQACFRQFEQRVKFNTPNPVCPDCAGESEKILAVPSPAQWSCTKGSL